MFILIFWNNYIIGDTNGKFFAEQDAFKEIVKRAFKAGDEPVVNIELFKVLQKKSPFNGNYAVFA